MARLNRERSTSSTRQLGQHGEDLAAQYLMQRGYSLVTRNWRCEAGEIDLIMRQGDIWVFVEVKTLSHATTEAAALKVNRAKQRRLVRCLYLYLEAHQLDVDTRVDVIAIVVSASRPPIIEHREDILEFDLFSDDA
jgi:putative endonuclease